MPTYDFLNEKTGETFTEVMSIAEKEEYLKKNSINEIQYKILKDSVEEYMYLYTGEEDTEELKEILTIIKNTSKDQ